MPSQYGELADRGFVRSLQTRFSLSPDFSLSLMPELAAVLSFEAPELLYHQGWRRWQKGFLVPGVAAQAGKVKFRVVDAATSLVVLERVLVSTSNAAGEIWNVDLGYGPAGLDFATTEAVMEFRDGRTRPSAGSAQVVISRETNAVVLGASAATFGTTVNLMVEVPGGPWVLMPGNEFAIGANGLNQDQRVNFVWRERVLQEQENTP